MRYVKPPMGSVGDRRAQGDAKRILSVAATLDFRRGTPLSINGLLICLSPPSAQNGPDIFLISFGCANARPRRFETRHTGAPDHLGNGSMPEAQEPYRGHCGHEQAEPVFPRLDRWAEDAPGSARQLHRSRARLAGGLFHRRRCMLEQMHDGVGVVLQQDQFLRVGAIVSVFLFQNEMAQRQHAQAH